MRHLRLFFAFLAVVVALASCQKDEKLLTLTFEKPVGAGKVYVDANYGPHWVNGDKVKINGTEYTLAVDANGDAVVSVGSRVQGKYYAAYPSRLADQYYPNDNKINVNIPRNQLYSTTTVGGETVQVIDAPMVALSSGSTLEFKNCCSLLKVQLTSPLDNAKLLDINVSTNNDLNIAGLFGYIFTNGIPSTSSTGLEKSVTLQCINEVMSSGEVRDYYLWIAPKNTSLSIQVRFLKDGHIYSYSRSQTSAHQFERNVLYPVSAVLSQWDAPAVTSITDMDAFTVYDHHGVTKTVCFATGNLLYQPSTNSWRIAEHPWSICGNGSSGNVEGGNNDSPSAAYSSWMDLFGWGTSGHNDRYPYMTDRNNSSYPSSVGGLLPNDYDWGRKNQSSITLWDGTTPLAQQGSVWRVWTSAEMNTMLFYRRTLSGKHFARATVAGVSGMIIFPDNFDPNSCGLTINGMDGGTNSSNNYSAEDWEDHLSHCVFLPAAGYRQVNETKEVGSRCTYWTVSSNSADGAMLLQIYQNSLSVESSSKSVGRSVRLMMEENGW